MKVLHLSTTGSTGGGAGRAAASLHRAMLQHDINSHLWTASGLKYGISKRADRQLWRLQRTATRTWRSPAFFGSIKARDIDAFGADVVNLHWVTDGFLSIEQIGKIHTPVVFSLYDMWVFAGSEHYGVNSPDARWRTGYTSTNRSRSESGFDLDRWTWQRKRKSWSPMPLIAASSHFAGLAQESALARDWSIRRIPHVIDTEEMAPNERSEARRALGIRHDDPIVLFLSSGGVEDQRKGFDLLLEAMCQVIDTIPHVQVLVVGPHSPSEQRINKIPVHFFGTTGSNETLRLLYNAADVTAVPSREDNMPLTAMEAQACGCAVVAFDLGGLPDIVEHRKTGFLAVPLDTGVFAEGLILALGDSRDRQSWGSAARLRAEREWSSPVVVSQYLDAYEEVRGPAS